MKKILIVITAIILISFNVNADPCNCDSAKNKKENVSVHKTYNHKDGDVILNLEVRNDVAGGDANANSEIKGKESDSISPMAWLIASLMLLTAATIILLSWLSGRKKGNGGGNSNTDTSTTHTINHIVSGLPTAPAAPTAAEIAQMVTANNLIIDKQATKGVKKQTSFQAFPGGVTFFNTIENFDDASAKTATEAASSAGLNITFTNHNGGSGKQKPTANAPVTKKKDASPGAAKTATNAAKKK